MAAGSPIPGLVSIAMEEFVKVLGDKPNQWSKQRDDVNTTAADLLNFQPEQPITEAGLRNNISVGIQYLGSWLAGNGCVPIYNLMEDAATAEISRSQVWQWIRSPKGVLDDGRKVTKDLVRALIPVEMTKDQGPGRRSRLLRNLCESGANLPRHVHLGGFRRVPHTAPV